MLKTTKKAHSALLDAVLDLKMALKAKGVEECENKAGMRRVRTFSLKVEKLAKEYRKASLELEK